MRRLRWLVLLTVAIGGCSEKTIVNNYYWSTTGGISGRVVPADSGTVVMTSDSARVKRVEPTGFFVLDSMPTGVYGIVIVPINYSRRSISNVTVTGGQFVSLGNISLSKFPYPFFGSDPSDGEDSVSLSAAIRIYSDEKVVIGDLMDLATMTPPLKGEWREQPDWTSGAAPYWYYYFPSESMQVATHYTLRVPSSVHLASGHILGRDLIIKFSTVPFGYKLSNLGRGLNGGVPLLYFGPAITFNAPVDRDSLNKAVTFTPQIPGIWLETGSGARATQFSYVPIGSEPLLPETDYIMVFNNLIPLNDGLYLPKPDAVHFRTEPVGVLQAYPQNGTRMRCTLCAIQLQFNTTMDTESVEGAFSLRDVAADTTLPGTFEWYGYPAQMRFSPNYGMAPWRVYEYTLAATAQSASGHKIWQAYSASFIVIE